MCWSQVQSHNIYFQGFSNQFKFHRLANKEELFKLQLAQACNIVEHIFGVLKKWWDILNQAPQYDMVIQAGIPPGLGAVHNFIVDHDNTDITSVNPSQTPLRYY